MLKLVVDAKSRTHPPEFLSHLSTSKSMCKILYELIRPLRLCACVWVFVDTFTSIYLSRSLCELNCNLFIRTPVSAYFASAPTCLSVFFVRSSKYNKLMVSIQP